MIIVKPFIILLLVLFEFSSQSQENKIYSDVIESLIGLNFNKSKKLINEIENEQKKIEFKILYDILYNRGYEKEMDSLSINKLKKYQNKDFESSIVNLLSVAYYNLYNGNDNANSFQLLDKSYTKAKDQNNLSGIKLSLLGFLSLYSQETVQNSDSFKDYLAEFKMLATTEEDLAWVKYFDSYFIFSNLYTKEEDLITQNFLIKYIKKNDLSIGLKSFYYRDIGLYYKTTNKIDSSKFFFNKVLELPDENHVLKNKFSSSLYLAEIEARNKNYQKAREYFKKSINYINYFDSIPYLFSLERKKSVYFYEKIPLLDSAYWDLKKSIYREAQLNIKRNSLKISELNVKLQTEKKEKDNLLLTAQKKRNQNIAISLGGSMALGSIIVFLVFKNTKRKQRIAEQEKELQSQKLATVLKEQELTAIDAMIEGQEKERQRIANDLHDDLGGLMTNVKWHFDALKEKQSSKLFDKTNILLDEAYQKIRGIAHAKNSGVIAKQGLLKAIKHMAEKVSALNKIQINVVDHGLENRLENSLELTIFRIIQELITNIIKHAQATEAIIHITNHEESLNILVEDNGKGFNPSQITKTNKGMGISSIDKRVEHMEGTMTIESEPKKGTTIIIDIPL